MAPTLLVKGSLVARMGESQKDLNDKIPINYIMEWIGRQIDNKAPRTMSDRVVILLSKTGSGKSSSIAPYLYLRFYNRYRKWILITQPRVLTCMEIPKDIAKIESYKKPNKEGLSIELYGNLGYQTGVYVKKPPERGILFCTTGILLQFLKNMTDEKFIKRYKFIIIDEAHDRSLDVDLVLLMMKNLIKRNMSNNPPFLILMSATLDVDQYSKYFDTKTVFEVSGLSKPIEVVYPEVDVANIYAKTCDIVRNLDKYETSKTIERDMIVFMASPGPIKTMISNLNELNSSLDKKILPISITRDDINGETENFRLILEDAAKLRVVVDGKIMPVHRRVIVSTNVAETGLTLEMLRYCVDTGLQFSSEFNPRYNMSILFEKPTTSSMSLQRKGRVGRKTPGVFFPLFTEQTFNDMIVMNTPSISVENMTEHLLALIAGQSVISIDKLPMYSMLTPPSPDSVNSSLERLFLLGAIDSTANITKIGKMMNTFRKICVESRRMILAGATHGASLKELVCLACLMGFRKDQIVIKKSESGVEPFSTTMLFEDLYEINPTYDRSKCDMTAYSKLKASLLVGCEMLEMLLIYQRFSEKAGSLPAKDLRKWCESKGLRYFKLCSITESIDEVFWQMLEQLKINPLTLSNQNEELYQSLKRSSDVNDTDLIESVSVLKRCIYDGYRGNLLLWNEQEGAYITRLGLKVVVKSPLVSKLTYQKIGAAFEQDRPRMLLYSNLVMKQNNKTGRFEAEAAAISVMDGFVKIDPVFESS